jgi:transposase InsO family protein
MARKVTSMKVIAAVTAFVAGQPMDVTQVCRSAGISRKTFYKWAARCRADGLDGLEERSRRPRVSPNQTPANVEDVIVRLRKELADAGLDHGATTIQWHLGQDRSTKRRVPSVAAIHRILVRRGLVTAQPHKRPKMSWRRFEAPAPNEWWQIDAMDWTIATGVVKVFNIIDDHSRVATRSRAVLEATSVEAWTTFGQATQHWGMPAGVLSDNGLCFSGKLRGFEVLFEKNLRDAGIRPFTGRPYHPQTTGKVERFQQTLKKWLRHQRLAGSLAELQQQLDTFTQIYNHQRPHQGIGRATPASRWHANPPTQPSPTPLPHPEPPTPARPRSATVAANGNINIDKFTIHVGAAYTGHHATVTIDDHHANIYIADQLIRHLKLDHTRTYQPSGRPRGGPRQPRLPS